MITDEQWAKVEQDLQRQLKMVVLQCDNFAVSLHLGQIGKMKLDIMVYVDGWFRGEWILEKQHTEEARRFFPTRYHYVYSPREKKLYKKLGKKFMKEYKIDLNKRIQFKDYYWSSFKSLKRHFIKNNQNIELIEDKIDAGYQCTA